MVRPLRKGDWVGVKESSGKWVMQGADEWQVRTVSRASSAVGYVGHGGCGFTGSFWWPTGVQCFSAGKKWVSGRGIVMAMLILAVTSWASESALGQIAGSGNYITGPNPVQRSIFRSPDAYEKVWVPRS